ncbi:FimB/Mfa2 family fimbrial subunit [uncultured Prevotella sp.]|uniref:FimB/Mfa2 family fimbrial subunit n=1 Tax=uncultured Prevotella sp. TaxID=159272 RepID=UPI0026129502|nr:FimB/Mfa2 family fimbrial subunit [uncultured Prevotella sp.]
MNKMKQHIYKAMLWLLPWLCAVPLASCSFDDDIDQGGDGTATLQLSITAREEGDLNTRADEVGTNGEYMHNLCVLIVGGNNVVTKKLLPNTDDEFAGNTAAQQGNLKSWVSDPFTLPEGTYTVYAFANIDTYYDGLWGSLTGLGDGESLTEKGIDIDNIVLEDPAAKLNFAEGKFIPMSAKQTVVVTAATKSISIGLDRLVSKIRMSISGKANTKVTALSFGGYADKITLFSDKTLEGATYTTTKNITVPGDGTLKADGTGTTGTLVIPDFYVNSSPAGHPFNVSVTTDEMNGITYEATTARSELPRNSIFPLTLQLNDYGLDLAAQCWVSPIGSMPVEVTVGFTQDTYEITVPEGCQFEFTVNGINGATAGVTGLSCTWNMPDGVSGIDFDGEAAGVTTVKGHVTASAGKTFDLSLLVTWQYNGATYNRTYTVKLTTADLTNYPLYSKQTRTPEFGLDYLRHEMLNMFKK